MVKTTLKTLITKYFSCCGDYRVQRKRYNLDDVKIDSEISDMAAPEGQQKMKKMHSDKLSVKREDSGSNAETETKSKLDFKTAYQQHRIKEDANKKSELAKKKDTKRMHELGTNEKVCGGLYPRSRVEAGYKFLSSGMVKMAIAKRNKSNEKIKTDLYKHNQTANIQPYKYNGKENEEPVCTHKSDAKNSMHIETIKNKELFGRKHIHRNQDSKKAGAEYVTPTNNEPKEDMTGKASNTETYESNNDQAASHTGKLNASSVNSKAIGKGDTADKGTLNAQYKTSHRGSSRQALVEQNVCAFKNEKSIEEYLLEESFQSESHNIESETEVSCSIDFYDKREFSRILLKTIRHYLQETQASTKKDKKR